MAVFANADVFVATLDRMIANLKQDERFLARIANASMSIGWKITDIAAEYTTAIEKGTVTGSVGGADTATIAVSCSSEVFEKLLTGKLSGESAYMTGAIRLRGNEWTAESAAAYLYYFVPAYKTARGLA
ncbi:MAG: SCP2 sterol-binding domain-containing protein [Chloroflexi bacterium]|nr:SCP2 sterol-binding domain-containing protein [Chloroflexota bacterium]